jgi:hypothetical protein
MVFAAMWKHACFAIVTILKLYILFVEKIVSFFADKDMEISRKFEILFLSPNLLCPRNPRYGSRVNRFVVSKLFGFGGRYWQLRTVQTPRNGHYVLLPFFIDPQGSHYNRPIFSDASLSFLGFQAADRAILSGVDRPNQHLRVPLPLGLAQNPFSSQWGSDREREIRPDDLRFNLIGSENASAIMWLHHAVRHQPNDEQVLQVVLRDMTEDFQMQKVPSDFLQREITALRESIMHGGNLWNEREVPIDPTAFDV